MEYLILLGSVCLASFLFIRFYHQKKYRQHVEKLKDSWGAKFYDTTFPESTSRRYFDATKQANVLDNKTWSDLNFFALFQKMDHTLTAVGRQFLYALLRRESVPESELATKQTAYLYFSEEKNETLKIRKILLSLDPVNSGYIVNLLYKRIPTNLKEEFYVYVFSLLTVIFSFLVFFDIRAVVLLIITVSVNIYLNKRLEPLTKIFQPYLYQLRKLLHVAISLADKNSPVPQRQELNQMKEELISVNKSVTRFAVDKTTLDEMSQLAFEFLNTYFNYDCLMFLRAMKHLKRHQNTLQKVFECVGSLDAEIAISSFLDTQKVCFPTVHEPNNIQATNLVHPLIDEPVPNHIEIHNNSLLITGSNMAGKTTFMKTLGVNLILAQSLGFAFAETFFHPTIKIRSSIRREDSLIDGKSYYFQEVEEINEFLTLSKSEDVYLFLIDEIYRGTNTTERISSAAAVMNYLSESHLVVASTHDLELQHYVHERFQFYHFCEQVTDGRFYFDYLLKPGISKTRNAIKLLELMGYPDEITAQAYHFASTFDHADIEAV